MSAGIRVVNDSGTVQIDDQYSNLRLIQKGTVPIGKTEVSIAGSFPILVLRLEQPVGGGPDLYVFQEACVRRGASWVYTIGTTLGGVAKPGTVVEYYAFDKAAPRTSTFGMQTFNSSGELIYDANEKYLKILRSIHVANFKTIGVIPVPEGRKAGIVFGRFPGKTQTYYQPAGNLCFTRLYTAGMNNVAGGVRIGETWFFSRTDFGYCSTISADFPEFTCLVVDLTGM